MGEKEKIEEQVRENQKKILKFLENEKIFEEKIENLKK